MRKEFNNLGESRQDYKKKASKSEDDHCSDHYNKMKKSMKKW